MSHVNPPICTIEDFLVSRLSTSEVEFIEEKESSIPTQFLSTSSFGPFSFINSLSSPDYQTIISSLPFQRGNIEIAKKVNPKVANSK